MKIDYAGRGIRLQTEEYWEAELLRTLSKIKNVKVGKVEQYIDGMPFILLMPADYKFPYEIEAEWKNKEKV